MTAHARFVNPAEFVFALGLATLSSLLTERRPIRTVTVIMADPDLRPKWLIEMVGMLAEDHIFAGEPPGFGKL
jgi:hypothetical protein